MNGSDRALIQQGIEYLGPVLLAWVFTTMAGSAALSMRSRGLLRAAHQQGPDAVAAVRVQVEQLARYGKWLGYLSPIVTMLALGGAFLFYRGTR